MTGAAMDCRPLGGTGLEVSGLSMGCAKLGAFWQGRTPREGRRALDEARHGGINLFDTADCYARGIGERILGRAFQRHRDEVVISTKVGMLKTPPALAAARRAESGRAVTTADLKGMTPEGDASQCFAPRYVETAVEACLRRLATDRVELLLLHWPSVDVLRASAFLPAVERLRASGKIRYFGASCRTQEEGRAAMEVQGVNCVQVPHNLAGPALDPEMVTEAHRQGIGLLTTAPFGDGRILAAGRRLGLPADAVIRACLAEPLSTPGVASVLVGMSTADHVGANLRAAASPLPASDIDLIRRSIAGAVPPAC